MRQSLDTHGGIVKGGGYAPLHVQSMPKWELFRKFPFWRFKLSTLCRQLDSFGPPWVRDHFPVFFFPMRAADRLPCPGNHGGRPCPHLRHEKKEISAVPAGFACLFRHDRERFSCIISFVNGTALSDTFYLLFGLWEVKICA